MQKLWNRLARRYNRWHGVRGVIIGPVVPSLTRKKMTVIRREKPVPTLLPNARLYIDDIQELVRVLTEAGNGHPVQPGKKGTEVLFQVGDQLCDQIEDLSKCESSRNFELQFSCEQRGYNVRLGISWPVCQWTSTGLTKDESWSLFHKIEAVFNARKIYRLIPERTSPVRPVLPFLTVYSPLKFL